MSKEVEEKIAECIYACVSQKEIIRGLVESRGERKTESGMFVEVYIALDCRPKMNFEPYKEFVDRLI